MIHHLKLATRHFIFWSLLATAIGLTSVRLLLTGIDTYKSELAGQISELVGAPVTIGRLSAKMRGFSPELVLRDINVASIDATQKPAVALKEIRLGIDLLATVINQNLLSSSWVTLIGAKLSVQRKIDGSFAIIGLQAGDNSPTWLLAGRKYEVLQSEVTWQDMQTATKPLKIDAVNLAIINNGDWHRINVMAQLPAKHGGALTLSMSLQGNIFEPSAINGTLFVQVRQLNLAAFPPEYLPSNIAINSGKSDVRLWATLQQAQLVSLQGEAQLQQLQLQQPQQGDFSVKHLETRFHWHAHTPSKASTPPQWQLNVSQFLLTTTDTLKHKDKQWPDAVFSIAGYGQDNTKPWQHMGLAVRQIDLQELSRLTLLFAPLPKAQAGLLAEAQLQGTLKNFSAYADLEAKQVAVNGEFQQLGFLPVQQIPGVANLTGKITGTLNHGVLRLTTDDGQVSYPTLFRKALIIKRLEGRFAWQQNLNDWTLSSPLFTLDLLSIKSKNRLRLVLPKTTGQPFVDLQMALTDDDISQLKHYFPTKVMKPADIDWLDVAFVKGRIAQGGVLLYGNIGATQPPLFEAILDVDQVELRYAPDWPHFFDVAGRVLFLQNKMVCESRQGHSGKLNLIQATVINEAVGVSNQLQINGEVEGQITDALGFLQQTPLNATMGPLINAVTTQGVTQVGLDLDLALNVDGYTKLNGNAQLNQAKLKVKAIDLWLNKINGVLKFNEHGVYSDTINAVALDNPVKITIDNTATETNVNVAGRTAIDTLKKQFKMPLWDTASGALDYQLKLGLPVNNNTDPTLRVQSDLVGVALDLPGKLAKTVSQSKPLALTFSLGDEVLLPIAISYDKQLQAAVKLNVATQSLHGGHILLGPGTVTQPADNKLTLEINQDNLELHDLIGFAGVQNTSQDSSQDSGIQIKKIHIHSNNALWKNNSLGAFDLALKPEGRYWAGTIDSAFAHGKIHIPVAFNQNSQITADMDKLDLAIIKQFKSDTAPQLLPAQPSSPLMPDRLPLFAINCRKTLWQTVDLGQLIVKTERIPGGIAFKQAELSGLEQQLTLSGEWKNSGEGTVTTVHGYLELPNVEQLFTRLDITKEFKETQGHINFSASWNAPPYGFSLADLSGEIDVNLKEGRLLSIEPGFGRVLGMLAMAQWTKRLQFDFRDMYEEGLMFNSIKGHFDIVDGIASTNNLLVDAIPAKINLTGRTDFVKKTVDHIVFVNPKSADAVPIAGTIMGNIMTLVTQTLTGDDYKGFFLGSQYQVKGKWDNMQIIQLHENDGLLQKTWTGITNFPWLQNSGQ